MTIHMVTAHNGLSYEDYKWWNIKAFRSRKKAQEYLDDRNNRLKQLRDRLSKIKYYETPWKLTPDERKELSKISDEFDYLGFDFYPMWEDCSFKLQECELEE